MFVPSQLNDFGISDFIESSDQVYVKKILAYVKAKKAWTDIYQDTTCRQRGLLDSYTSVLQNLPLPRCPPGAPLSGFNN